VGERRGREFRQRARVRARWSTASTGREELIGEDLGAERGRAHGAMARRLVNRAREAEREEGARAKGTSADSLAPLGSERERERRVRGRLALTGGVHLLGATGVHGRVWWAGLGRIGFFLFPEFPNCFSIPFL
jgi:hypothetical protein